MRAPLILSALLVAGCASGSTAWSYEGIPVTVPGAYGVTPMMKTMAYTWRPPPGTDARQAQRDLEICNTSSRTTLGSMMFGGDPPLRRFEDCFERLGYVMTGKKAGGDPVPRGYGRGCE